MGQGAEKIDASHTHKWCCYVRGVENEDISRFVKIVEFVLDKDSFKEPEIRIMTPPFEIHQTGWGEFSIGVNLYFHDESLAPIKHYKQLHLFDAN